jgi:hypothetical protein
MAVDEGGKAGPGKKTGVNSVRLSRSPHSRAYILARLDRDGHTELAAKVRAGELSANAAAIAVYRKQPSPIEQAHKLVPKLTDIEWEALKRDEDARRLAKLAASEAAEDAG